MCPSRFCCALQFSWGAPHAALSYADACCDVRIRSRFCNVCRLSALVCSLTSSARLITMDSLCSTLLKRFANTLALARSLVCYSCLSCCFALLTML